MQPMTKKFDYDNATEEERRSFREKAFWDSPLDEEEQWYEDHADEFVPCKNQEEMRQQLIEAARNTTEEAKQKTKKPVTINLDGSVISYFKELASETGVAYQVLINMYLVQCAKEKKRPVFA